MTSVRTRWGSCSRIAAAPPPRPPPSGPVPLGEQAEEVLPHVGVVVGDEREGTIVLRPLGLQAGTASVSR